MLKDFLEEVAATARPLVSLNKPENAIQLSDISIKLGVRKATAEAIYDTQETIIDALDPDDFKLKFDIFPIPGKLLQSQKLRLKK